MKRENCKKLAAKGSACWRRLPFAAEIYGNYLPAALSVISFFTMDATA